MICEQFNDLTHREKIEYIGKLLHGVQSCDKLFIIGQAIIKQAEERGILTDVIINPDTNETT